MDLHLLPAHSPKGGYHMVVESPRGSGVKLKYDPALGVMGLSRPLPLGLSYPYDWGFIPGTRAPDGDPVDALLCWDMPSFPGVVIPSRPLGLLELEQDGKNGSRTRNDRLILLPLRYRRGDGLLSVDDLPQRVREEIQQFFLSSVFFEQKNPAALGWKGPADAEALIAACTLG